VYLCKRRVRRSCRRQGSCPSSRPYHPKIPPSTSAVIFWDSDPVHLSSENVLVAVVTGGGPWRNEMHFRRSSSQSQGRAPRSATRGACLFCEQSVLGKRTQLEQSSLGWNDVVGRMKDMRRWRVGGTSTGTPRISRLLDSTL
jgi:hypothetical protein